MPTDVREGVLTSILSVFKDSAGNPSSMRILVFMVVAVVLFNWTWLNLKSGQFTPIPWENVALVIGSLFAKSSQKSVEERTTRQGSYGTEA